MIIGSLIRVMGTEKKMTDKTILSMGTEKKQTDKIIPSMRINME
jgi:hypothetical protein